MPFYLIQWSYSDNAIKSLLADPADREPVVRRAAEGHGGKLHSFFMAFGEYDGAAITEFPDNASAAAFAMTVGAGGAVDTYRTTPLMTPQEATAAMQKAKAAQSSYRPPGG